MKSSQSNGYLFMITRQLISDLVAIPILLILYGLLAFTCRRIAPHPQLAAVVFGFFFCLFQGLSAYDHFESGYYFLTLTQSIYSIIVLGMVAHIYKSV